MNKDSKLVVFTILFCFLVLLFSINFVSIKADSGWDSSFDSDWGSSSWDSGSDWGSSWDSGSDWGSSYSSSSSDGSFLFLTSLLITPFFPIRCVCPTISSKVFGLIK